MIRLVYSNRTEELIAELARRVRAQQASDGALVPVRLVVPSASVESYVRLGIARIGGVAANLDAMLLTRFAAEAVNARSGARLAGAEALEGLALTLLLDESFLDGPDLAPLRAYVGAGGSRDDVSLRRTQLAGRIGRLFEEYTYSRADMLLGWQEGTALDAPYAETERWQRALWLAMFGPDGLSRARGLVPLHEAMSRWGSARAAHAGAVHVFGFARFAPVFHELFARTAAAAEVVLYSLSPCEGFWEDADPADPELLQRWGRPGREHVRALDAIAGFDHEDHFVEPDGETLLGRLQRDVLWREPARERVDAQQRAFDGDASLRVLEHASVRRELEAVASEIWELVRHDATLRFDEIAVLVPDEDVAEYLAHLPAVFGEAHGIPFQRVGLPLTGDEHILSVIEMLLALPFGRFTRQDLLRVAVHPCVAAALDGVDPRSWLGWCGALGVVHGADRSDHEGTYIERDILNWDQGLRRLALGAFMAGDASGDRRPYELGGEAYVPHEVAPADLRHAAAFGLLLRSLMADARFVRDAELTLPRWAELLATLVSTYVAPTSSADAESLARALRRLGSVAALDIGDKPVPYRVASEIARRRLASTPKGRGGEGVVVSCLNALRPVPFRVVFACGMGEGRFPSTRGEDPLDLRWARPRACDVSARERDKYAFFELLMGVGDRLYLSYVSRDALTGDALAPSSVVQELLHALGRSYVRNVASLRRRHPLRRWDPQYFPEVFGGAAGALGTMRLPEAHGEARTLALRRSMEARRRPATADEIVQRAAGDPAWAALADHLGIARLPPSDRASEARAVVPMYALVKFLEFPLQGWARFRVGLDEREEEDVLAREDEPFETDTREETLLLREVALGAAAAGCSVREAYDHMVRERELRGLGPSGVFALGERSDHLRTLETWESELRGLGVGLGAMVVRRFGRAGEHATVDRAHDPLALDVEVTDGAGVSRVVRVEVGGRTLPLGDEGAASVTLFRRAKEGNDEWVRAGRARATLRAFVDHAVLAATGVAEARAHASIVVVATPQGSVTERVRFAPISRTEATVWLRTLVGELLGGPHAYFLPAEAVFVREWKDPQGPITPWLEDAREQLRDSDGPLGLRSAYGPVPRPQDYPAPDEASARAMIANRFGPIFQRIELATSGEPSASSRRDRPYKKAHS
ncbi:MAG: exodeoxyribonuclease V subunit gamma [Myxococcota bacterium]|nr:exodeoxyribonuclease V subunit gamma [Myxococcota bacterium]